MLTNAIFKDIIKELLEAELEAKLGYAKNDLENKNTDNSRNGYSTKTLKSEFGEVEIQIPRDRKGEFKPQIIPKYQRDVSGIEEKVIALYARGMSTRDISEQIEELYGFNLSPEMVSKITDRIAPEIKEWQQRPLEPIYTFVFMDAILSKAFHKIASMNSTGYTSERGRFCHSSICGIILSVTSEMNPSEASNP